MGTGEEVNRNHLSEVIVQERLPGLAGRPRQSPEDSGDSTFGDLDAEQVSAGVETCHCFLSGNLSLDRDEPCPLDPILSRLAESRVPNNLWRSLSS